MECKKLYDYHQKFHKRMLKNIALNVELLRNDNFNSLSEYDIQAFMSFFLQRNLHNSGFTISRELFGRFDCAIADKVENTPLFLYEIKTYLKSSERILSVAAFKAIIKDFNKLKLGIEKNNSSRGYFIMVCRSSYLRKFLEKENIKVDLEFIKKWLNEKSKQWITLKGKNIRLRHSAKIEIENTTVLSWEIK